MRKIIQSDFFASIISLAMNTMEEKKTDAVNEIRC